MGHSELLLLIVGTVPVRGIAKEWDLKLMGRGSTKSAPT